MKGTQEIIIWIKILENKYINYKAMWRVSIHFIM